MMMSKMMMKKTVLAMVGLAFALTLASPSRANAAVVVGLNVGPVYARPAYGYVYVHPRPYIYARPYAYAPAYVYPNYGYYGRVGRGYYRPDFYRRDYAYRGRWNRHEGWRR